MNYINISPMAKIRVSSAIRLLLDTLAPHQRVSADDIQELWGPITALQYDSAGSVIQKYVSILVQESSGRWKLVRQINRMENGYEWTSRPIAHELTPTSARDWLAQNNLSAVSVGVARQ
ncbi:MAG: hypothetical protein ACO1RA_18330 [Planctomycetaceae bacterium]